MLLHLLLHALLPLLPGELLHLILHLHQQQQRIAGSGYLLTLHIKQPFNPRTPGPGRLKTRLSFLGTSPHPTLHPSDRGHPLATILLLAPVSKTPPEQKVLFLLFGIHAPSFDNSTSVSLRAVFLNLLLNCCPLRSPSQHFFIVTNLHEMLIPQITLSIC